MKIASLLLNIFDILLVPASLYMLIPTAMMFDAPGSEKKKTIWFVASLFFLFPLVALASLVVGWWKWHEGDYNMALRAGALAPIYIVFTFTCLFSICGK